MARALPYLPLAMLSAIFHAPCLVSDSLQQGAGRPWTYLVSLFLENLSRLRFFFVFVSPFGFGGIPLATVAAYAPPRG